jgi:hypothetical protein
VQDWNYECIRVHQLYHLSRGYLFYVQVVDMRALDDIIIGFFIFFAIERGIRLFSNAVIEPWAQKRTENENVVENWKIGTELVCLLLVTFITIRYRKVLQGLDTR